MANYDIGVPLFFKGLWSGLPFVSYARNVPRNWCFSYVVEIVEKSGSFAKGCVLAHSMQSKWVPGDGSRERSLKITPHLSATVTGGRHHAWASWS